MALKIAFVGRDLTARSRLEAAGAEVWTVAPESLDGSLTDRPADVLVIDLDENLAAVAAPIERAARAGVLPAKTWGYYSHVDEAVGARAAELPLRALPRGRFWRTLREILEGA